MTRYSDGARAGRRTSLVRRLLLPAMTLAFLAYVIVHSPLRSLLARLAGRGGRTQYFGSIERFSAGLDAPLALVSIAAALLAAAMVTRRIDQTRYERPLIIGIVAYAFIVVPAAFVGGFGSWWGMPLLRRPLGLLLTALPALLVAGFGVRRGWRPSPIRLDIPRTPLLLTLGILAACLIGTSAAIALARPPTGFDALSYHAPIAVYLWRDGNLTEFLDRAPSGFAMAHPGAGELWFGLLLAGFGERVANLGQLPFAFLGALAVHAFARRTGLRTGAAGVGSLAFLVAPMVVAQAGVQLNDLLAAALIMSAAALCGAPPAIWKSGRTTMIGLALGLAVTTKLSMLPAAAGICVVGLVSVMRAHSQAGSGWGRLSLGFSLAFAVAVAPWWSRNVVRYGNPIYPAALPVLGRGVVVGDFEKKDHWFVPAAGAWPLYPVLEGHGEMSGFGPLFLVGALPGVLAAARIRRRPVLLLYGALAGFSLPAWWLLTQHEPRLLLPAIGLAFSFVPWMLAATPRPWRHRAAVLLMVAGGFSAVVTYDQALAPRALEPPDRAQFYDQLWGVDPDVAGPNGPPRLLYNTGYASLSYAGDYPLLGASLDRVLLVVDTDISTAAIVELMKRHRVEYAYVPASPESQARVRAAYTRELFEEARVSEVKSGDRKGTRRYLFRLRERPS